MDSDAATAGVLGQFGWMVRGLLTILFGIFGCTLFAMIGSMTYPGIGAIVGAIVGFVFWGSMGCCIVGFWRDILGNMNFDASATNLMPSALLAAGGGHPEFQVIVTVHEVKDLTVIGRVFTSPDPYVVVECGNNPRKCTCVSKTGDYNEQFKLTVRPSDASIMFRVMDQDLFGSTELAHVNVKVDGDILNNSKRTVRREFKLQTSATTKLRNNNAKLSLTFFAVGYDVESNQVEDYGATRGKSAVLGSAFATQFTKKDVIKG